MRQNEYRLPYMEDRNAVLITVVINVAFALLFQFSEPVLHSCGIIQDAVICGAVTAIIDTLYIWRQMEKRRCAGMLPGAVPLSTVMQRLPKGRWGLLGFNALLFAVLAGGAVGLFLYCFGISQLNFMNWLIFKLFYVWLLSAKIVEFVIYRLIQPDWTGAADDLNVQAGSSVIAEIEVRDPLLHFSTLKAVYGSIAANIAMNFIMGSLFGGVVLNADGSLLVKATQQDGMWITGVMFGLIMGIVLTRAVLESVKQILPNIDETAVQELGRLPFGNSLLSKLPKRAAALTVFVCIITMLASAILLPLLMKVLQLKVMNFYQFCLFITAYGDWIGGLLSSLIMARCTRADYIHWRLSQAE